MSKLKPCPFCGYDPIVYEPTGRIECCAATCVVNPFSHSVASWNNRAENEHLRLKEEECKGLHRDKKELVNMLQAIRNTQVLQGDPSNIDALLEKHQC